MALTMRIKLRIELCYANRRIVITDIVWDSNLKTHYTHIENGKFPFNKKRSYKLTHVIYWLHTGKKVPKGKLIHHRDHESTNNLFENFQIMSWSDHAKHHHTGRIDTEEVRQIKKAAAIKRTRTPEFSKIASERAKRQHREKNFGAHTRHYLFYTDLGYCSVIGASKSGFVHILRIRKEKPYYHQTLCGLYPNRNFKEIPWVETKEQPTCQKCLDGKIKSDILKEKFSKEKK
jgi:HNH endonuclease